MPLLALPPTRLARETRHARDVTATEVRWYRAWRRRVVWLVLRCGAVYAAGGVLVGVAFATRGDLAEVAFWGGLLLSNAGPMVLWYSFWMREQGNW